MRATEPLGTRPLYGRLPWTPSASWKRSTEAWRFLCDVRERWPETTPKAAAMYLRLFEASRELVWAYGTEHWPESERTVDAWTIERGGHLYVITLEWDTYVRDPRDEGDCYSDEDVAAWHEDEWHFGVVVCTRQGEAGEGRAAIGGVEYGDYWPGDEAYHIWHLIDDLIDEADDDLIRSTRNVSAELAPMLPGLEDVA